MKKTATVSGDTLIEDERYEAMKAAWIGFVAKIDRLNEMTKEIGRTKRPAK